MVIFQLNRKYAALFIDSIIEIFNSMVWITSCGREWKKIKIKNYFSVTFTARYYLNGKTIRLPWGKHSHLNEEKKEKRQIFKMFILPRISFTVRLEKSIGYCQSMRQYWNTKCEYVPWAGAFRAIHSHSFRSIISINAICWNDFQICKNISID